MYCKRVKKSSFGSNGAEVEVVEPPGLKSLGNGRILEKQTEFVLNLS